MTYNRSAAFALVAGSLAGLVTMALHPTGSDVVHNASAGGSNVLATGVHALALVAQPLLLAGLLAVTHRLRARRDLAVGAYVFFAFAAVAIMIAGVSSGFVSPAVLRGIDSADEASRAAMMNAMHYTGQLNQAFARVSVMLTAVALLLWGLAMLLGRELSRGLAIFGLVLGVAMAAGVGSGRLQLDIHGFGAVVLGQAVWMIWAAVLIGRDRSGLGSFPE